MVWPVPSDIRRVDQALCQLADDRRRCDDPGDVLRISESIDSWLDERLALMRPAEHRGLFSAERSWNPAGR